MAWLARWQCALLPPSPSCLTKLYSAAGPHALLSLETEPEPQAWPGQGAQREET